MGSCPCQVVNLNFQKICASSKIPFFVNMSGLCACLYVLKGVLLLLSEKQEECTPVDLKNEIVGYFTSKNKLYSTSREL